MKTLYLTPLPGGKERTLKEVARVLHRSQEMVSLELKEQEVEIQPGHRQQPRKPQEVGVAHKI